MTDSSKSRPPYKVWMPRTHIAQGHSALSKALQQKGLWVLEHALQRIQDLGHLELAPDFSASWWVLTSAVAVAVWADYLQATEQTHRIQNVQIACVGNATAKAVETYLNRSANFVPKDAQDATYFATAFNEHHQCPSSCLWVCSALADDTLFQGLKTGGHDVQRVSLYKPIPLEADALAQLLEDAVAFSPDVVLLTSPSNVKLLARMGAFERVHPQKWICLGQRSLEAMLALGLQIPLEALEHPTAEAVLDACVKLD